MLKKKKPQLEVVPVPETTLLTSFIAGAAAGLVVDVALFPLDTLKTRLQSHHGFWKSGGFGGIYQGIGPVVIASAPTAAIFFVTYNGVKKYSKPYIKPTHESAVQVAAASFAEVLSCVVRVPCEVVKQRRQACINELSAVDIARHTLSREGVKGLYRGFLSTILRDIPCAAIQFPLWEFFKRELARRQKGHITPAEGAACGAVAGAISGAVTTPLDVIKTRQMLYDCSARKPPSVISVCGTILKERGVLGFFSGFVPRVVWIFLGGGVFFGVYEETCAYIEKRKP